MKVVDVVVLLLVIIVTFASNIKASESLEKERMVLNTEDGRILGFKEYSTKGLEFFTFHAIPYAKPPVGELRFKVCTRTTVMASIVRVLFSIHTHTHTHTHTLDTQNLVMMEEETKQMRGNTRRIRKSRCLKDTKKYSFPHRIVDTWNGLKEEVVTATSMHKYKEMCDIWRYEDETL